MCDKSLQGHSCPSRGKAAGLDMSAFAFAGAVALVVHGQILMCVQGAKQVFQR